jgi:hypothetical protein
MSAMIRTNDPRVTRIMAMKEAQTKFVNGRTYRTPASPAARSFSDRFPDGCWKGQRCFIIGGGPSLKGFDFERLRGERVIAINKAFKDAPFADIMFAMDHPLIELLASGKLGEDYRQAFEFFPGAKLWLDLSGYSYPAGVYSVPSAGATGWSTSLSQGLVHGNNSGYGALNLAMILGAGPIYLLGYDCKRGADGSKNYHNGYLSGSNPDAMNIFKREIEAGAKLEQAISHRIVNLNPDSALACFPFGDVDKILPKVVPMAEQKITVITPTGDRPLAFALLRRWMDQQTRKPDQWIVVDDGKAPFIRDPEYRGGPFQYIRREPRPTDPKHTLDLNMKAALPLISGGKILVMEDDEYYAPGYISEMSKHLDSFEVVGICRSKYYHLPSGGYQQIGNVGHASLAETGFRRSFIPSFARCIDNGIVAHWLDDQLWKLVRDSKGTTTKISSLLFVDTATPLYVGIKGLPGRGGMGMGHQTRMYKTTDSADRAILKQWIPKDYQVYLDVIAGKTIDPPASVIEPVSVSPVPVVTPTPVVANMDRFSFLLKTNEESGKRLNQHIPEWKAYLEYVGGYFRSRWIDRPVVVEIGILDGAQRRFYENLLNAEYIGIDIDPKSPADIHGNSADPGTVAKLKARLAGRQIDLLFIDGLHTYAGAKADYEIYGPLTKHIVAIHDIHTPKLTPNDQVEVYRLWNEILTENKTDTIITIQHHNPRRPEEFNGRPLGIGVIVKGGGK